MQLNFKQYKTLDIFIFIALVAIFETINLLAITNWFPNQLYSFSLMVPIVAIVMMRWGVWGMLHAGLSGLIFAIILPAENVLASYIANIGGNLFCVLAFLFLHFVGKQKVKENTWLSIAYVILVYLSVVLGKSIIALCFDESANIFVYYFARDAFSLVMGIVIVLIARRQNGLFEDQKTYLFRLEAEREEERRLKDEGML